MSNTILTTIKQLIAYAISADDNSTAKAVIDELKKYNGKKWTKRYLDKLNDAFPGYKFSIGGSFDTKLVWDGPSTIGHKDFYLVMEGGIIDTDYLMKQNPAVFEAADKRNEARLKVLHDDRQTKWSDLDALISALDRLLTARVELEKLFNGSLEIIESEIAKRFMVRPFNVDTNRCEYHYDVVKP